MNDRIREALDVLIEHMEEPPTWEELSRTGEVVMKPRSEEKMPDRTERRGPLVAIGAAALVAVAALVPLLTLPAEEPVDEGIAAVEDEVISGDRGPARFAVGFDADGQLCAQAGSATQSEFSCGGDDVTVVGFQAYTDLAVAGFVPGSAAEVELIYADGRRRSVDLVPVPGRESFAFGLAVNLQANSVEIEVTDDRGVVIDRQPVPVGSIADALGWETVPIPDGVVSEPMDAVWTGTELIFWGGYAYTPDAGSWRELPPLQAWASFLPTTGFWTGTEAIFCCGATGSVAVRGFDTFDKTSNAPFPLDPPVKAVWTGELMLVAAEGTGVAAYDPDTDQWELLAEPPTGIGFGPFFEVVWTGSEMIVWTLNEIGIALDPETRSWRTLPDPPETLEDFTHDDVAYAGNQLIVWGSYDHSQFRPEPKGVAGAILDLQTNEWVELPQPLTDPKPCECLPQGEQTTVWTGESLLISTSRLSRDTHTNEPALIAYHPDSNQWTYEGVSPLGWDLFNERGERAVMADDRVVLRSDKNLYISPPGWQPQGPPIPPNTLHAVEQP